MTRDEIIKMAQQATAPEWLDDLSTGWHMGLDLEHFAALVAATERETCAKVCEGEIEGRRKSGDWEGAAAADWCAAAIRARGEA